MKWFNGNRMRLLLVVFVAAIILGGESVKGDFAFGTPTNLGLPVNSASEEAGPSISADNLSLFFDSDRPGGQGAWDIWITTRTTVSDPWGEPVNLGPPINSSSFDFAPSISANGLELYFSSNRSGAWDLWVATRATVSDPWGEPINLGPTVNSSSLDAGPSISSDGLELLFFSNERLGGYGGDDLWVTTRPTISDDWGKPVNFGPTINSSNNGSPSISSDGLLLFFESDRPGGYGDWDVWVSRRASLSDPWEEPVNLGPTVNTTSAEGLPSVSLDGKELYFSDFGNPKSGGVGGCDLWQASIVPIVDLNSDGIVDATDMFIMVDNWGTDNKLCDIGPMPWGDGIVDVQDLIALADHLFEEIQPTEPFE